MAKKAGSIYLEIAKECLESWYSDMGHEERKALLARADYEELEGYIYAESSIKAAIRGLDKIMRSIWDYTLPKGLEDYVLFGTQLNKEDEAFLTGRRDSFAFQSPEVRNAFIIGALTEIHDQWVRDNVKKFFDPKREDKQYMFTHTLLIGWQETEKDLIFLEPIANFIGVKPYRIEESYNAQAQEAIQNIGITPENLAEKLGTGKTLYYALDESIDQELKNNPGACERIAKQVLERTKIC